MKAATHNGTCQVCGREQANRDNGLAQHGYSVDAGYFRGVCRGSKRAPLEVAHELLDRTVENLRPEIVRLRKGITVETAALAGSVPAYYRKPGAGLVRVPLKSEAAYDALDYAVRMHLAPWVKLAAQQAYNNQREADFLASHIEKLVALKAERFGKPLEERVAR